MRHIHREITFELQITAFIVEQICLPRIISNDTNSEKKLWCFMF